jgi:hypothetical protein
VIFIIHGAAAVATTYAVSTRFADETAITFTAICGLALFILAAIQYLLSGHMEKFIIGMLIAEDESKSQDDRIAADTSAMLNRNWMIGLLLLDMALSVWSWRETVKLPPVKEATIEKTIQEAYKAAEDRYTAVIAGGYSAKRVSIVRTERDSAKTEYDNETLRVSRLNHLAHRDGDNQKMQRMLAAILGCAFAMFCLYQVRYKHEQNQYERLKSEIEAEGGESALAIGTKPVTTSNNKNEGVMERFARTNEQLQKQMMEQAAEHKKTIVEMQRQLKEQTELTKRMAEDARKKEVESANYADLQKQMEILQKEFSVNGNGASKNGNGNGAGK